MKELLRILKKPDKPMRTCILMLMAGLACMPMARAEKLKSSQVKEIVERYVQALEREDFSAWSELMLDTRGIDEKMFKERLDLAVFEGIEVEDIDKTKTGYNILLKFLPRIVVQSHENETSSMSRNTYWVQMLPDGKIKYDILISHPIPFAMSTCTASVLQLESKQETESGAHLQDYGIPLFGYDHTAPAKEQLKSLRTIMQWLLDEGEDWDRSDPRIPCPEDLYESQERSMRQFT